MSADRGAAVAESSGLVEGPEPPEELVAEWVARPDNSARSVIVTIFGDTIAPVSTGVWLAQLFRLTDVFGYSRRLVRTSVFRLAAEDWLAAERSGRESRYELTDTARRETDEASVRIYGSARADWSGAWCLVFLDGPHLEPEVRDRLGRHLGWHGFVALGRSVLASPGTSPERARALCRLVDPTVRVPMGVFEFADLEQVVADGFFDTTLALGELGDAYAGFVRFHRRVAAAIERPGSSPAGALDRAASAFALRTMLIHDLRRIRLRAADVPAELLPADWPGRAADELVERLYPVLGEAAAPWLSNVLDVTYPTPIPGRFEPDG